MIRVTCDTCDRPIDRDVDRWFGVDLNEPIPKPVAAHPDPVQAMNDLDDELMATATGVLRMSFGGDHEHHFCSAACLSSWAFGQELEDQ